VSLRKRLAEFGFESNDDYEFQLRCLFAARLERLRCLHVAGESGRRKTAFANALAHALDYPRVLYHDFTAPEPQAPVVTIQVDEGGSVHGATEAPMTAFERVLTEACAFSEAERTILILDQLQATEFQNQIRLYQFISGGEWVAGSGSMRANPKNLLLVLISETALYHSLARVSYRIWTDASGGRFEYRPEEFGLGLDARELFAALKQLFEQIGSVPTHTEFRHILDDLLHQVRTAEQLRLCLFGWMERIDHGLLAAPQTAAALAQAVQALNQFIGQEELELGGDEIQRAADDAP
jgi:hypothetical protein